MEENRQQENDASGYLPETKKDDNRTDNNMNQEYIPVVGNNTDMAKTPDNPSQNADNSANSANEISEDAEIGNDTVLKRYHNISQKSNKHGRKGLAANFSTIIVIAYTILLLVLGFFVYRDISKRLNNIEDRISTIETSIIKNQNITIDNIKIYDAE